MDNVGVRRSNPLSYAVDLRLSEAVIFGCVALLVGWAVTGRGLTASLVVVLVLDGLAMWWLHRSGWTAGVWLSLPVLELMGWVAAGSGSVVTFLWLLSVIVAISGAAFMRDGARRFRISVASLVLIVLGIVLGYHPVWVLLSVLGVPSLVQGYGSRRSCGSWVEWALVTLCALFIGIWVQVLVR